MLVHIDAMRLSVFKEEWIKSSDDEQEYESCNKKDTKCLNPKIISSRNPVLDPFQTIAKD